jgi:hypothetical protein
MLYEDTGEFQKTDSVKQRGNLKKKSKIRGRENYSPHGEDISQGKSVKYDRNQAKLQIDTCVNLYDVFSNNHNRG